MSRFAFVLALAVLMTLVVGSTDVVRHSRRKATTHSMRYLAHSLTAVDHSKRAKEFSNSTSLDRDFSDMTLFKFKGEITKKTEGDSKKPKDKTKKQQDNPNSPDEKTESSGNKSEHSTTYSAGIEITCATCYSKGKATASLIVDDGFNTSTILDTVKDAVTDTIDQIEDWAGEIDLLPFRIPPLDVDLDINLPDFPSAVLELQLDGFELYVELDTTFAGGVTYQVSLYKTRGMHIDIAGDMFLGAVLSFDLILSAEAELTIRSGFHVKLDDGFLLKMALFSEDASDIVYNGGKFEFLPVTIESAGTVLKAALQLSLRAGVEVFDLDLTPGFEVEVGDFNSEDYVLSAGAESRVYVNVAEFVTNITASDDDVDCALKVHQDYRFVVGAAAGASAALGQFAWGPTASTEIPIFTTRIAEVCAVSAPPVATTLAIDARAAQDDNDDLETTTLTTKKTTTGSATRSAIGFGNNAKEMITTSGKPAAYTGGGDNDNNDSFFDRKTGGVSNAIIVGVSVGLGVPIIIAIIAGIFLLRRRRSKAARVSPVETNLTTHVRIEPDVKKFPLVNNSRLVS
ncbi:hypothetical protein FPOAC1_000147 [Fusarium poae]|uniref:hypothetical protein n=1 Tax=Fusarium poae TaxID=36050 RepID=UPI001CEBDF8F|nr:hypothetical protein FPOAC1_000147 [Fusarium poae]KAG8674184.1 hypothetical protein FPOAC1_000147 [Fusarium poae]